MHGMYYAYVIYTLHINKMLFVFIEKANKAHTSKTNYYYIIAIVVVASSSYLVYIRRVCLNVVGGGDTAPE